MKARAWLTPVGLGVVVVVLAGGLLIVGSLDEGLPDVTRPLRERANRSWCWVPSVGPFDQFDGEDHGDGQVDLGETMVDEPVGVAA